VLGTFALASRGMRARPAGGAVEDQVREDQVPAAGAVTRARRIRLEAAVWGRPPSGPARATLAVRIAADCRVGRLV